MYFAACVFRIAFRIFINFQGVPLALLGSGFAGFRARALHSSARSSLAPELSPLQSLTLRSLAPYVPSKKIFLNPRKKRICTRYIGGLQSAVRKSA